jgi:hypothetical protein
VALFGLAFLAFGHVGMMISGDSLDGSARLAGLLASSALQGIGIGLLMGRLTVNALSRVSKNDSSLAAAWQRRRSRLAIPLASAPSGSPISASPSGAACSAVRGALPAGTARLPCALVRVQRRLR